MNKKFTFMVAALLAAGSAFAATKQINLPLGSVVADNASISGKYFIVYDDGSGTAKDLNASDLVLGMKWADETTLAAATSMTLAGSAGSWNITAGGENESILNYIWTVKEVKIEGDKVAYEFINEATQQKLAFSSAGQLVTKPENMTGASDRFIFGAATVGTADATKYKAGVLSIPGNSQKVVTVDGTTISLGESTVDEAMFLVKVGDTPITPAELIAENGSNFSLNFADEAEGTDVFSKVSVVEVVKSGSGSDLDNKFETTSGNFMLMVNGKPGEDGKFSLDTEFDAFKEAEFVVLSSEKVVENVDYANGLGFSYKIVKGSDLVEGTTGNEIKVNGKTTYPFANALFTAHTNVNNSGKLYLKQTNVISPDADEDDEKWAAASGTVYVGIGGLTSSKTVASVAEAYMLTTGKGTSVDVKKLVVGKKVVNVMLTEKNGSKFLQALKSDDALTGVVAVTADATETSASVAYPKAQWIVSANDDNTITLINRLTGAKTAKISLYETGVANTYSVKTTDTNLQDRYVKFVDVDTKDMFAGFLNLSDQELKNDYVLTTKGFKSGAITTDVAWAEGASNVLIPVAGDEEAEEAIVKFELAKVNKSVDGESVLDTAFIKNDYVYFKNGTEKKTATDSIAIVKYTLKDLKNSTSSAVKYLDINFKVNNASAQDVIFMQVAKDQYVMAKSTTLSDLDGSTYAGFSASNISATAIANAVNFTLEAQTPSPSYVTKDQHIQLVVNGANYVAFDANQNAVIANENSELKAATADDFKFWLYSADVEKEPVASYYLAQGGKMMYNATDSLAAYKEALAEASTIDEELQDSLKAQIAYYGYNLNNDAEDLNAFVARLKSQDAKYVAADTLEIGTDSISKAEDLAQFKFQLVESENGYFLQNANGQVVANNNTVLYMADATTTPLYFDIKETAAPTSNESVSASEVKVIANNGSVVVKNAAGKNVVVSTILGQVVANEVLTSDNATINVPAGIVVVAVEGESFKVNVK